MFCFFFEKWYDISRWTLPSDEITKMKGRKPGTLETRYIASGFCTQIIWLQSVIYVLDNCHRMISFFIHCVTSMRFSVSFEEQNANLSHPRKKRINYVQQIKLHQGNNHQSSMQFLSIEDDWNSFWLKSQTFRVCLDITITGEHSQLEEKEQNMFICRTG